MTICACAMHNDQQRLQTYIYTQYVIVTAFTSTMVTGTRPRVTLHVLCVCPILIIVQRDATQSSLFITLQVHSTCFG